MTTRHGDAHVSGPGLLGLRPLLRLEQAGTGLRSGRMATILSIPSPPEGQAPLVMVVPSVVVGRRGCVLGMLACA
jgi:hypothetical protein